MSAKDIAIVGDPEAGLGFRALGVANFVLKEDEDEIEKKFKRIIKEGYKIIRVP